MRALVVAALCLVASLAAGQDGRHGAIRAAVCSGAGPCRIETAVSAGHGARGALSVVRTRRGRPTCVDEARYEDWLVVTRGTVVRALRQLTRGDEPCLEWSPSAWTYEGGELVFRHDGMGAPYGSGHPSPRVEAHFRPWPLVLTAFVAGGAPSTPLPTPPAHGPLFVLSMDYEGPAL